MALSKSEVKKASEYAAAEEDIKCLAAESAGEVGKSDEGASAGYVVYNLDDEAVRKLMIGLGFCIVLLALLFCWMDRIVLAGSYFWIIYYQLD